jgi:hypothetical protein
VYFAGTGVLERPPHRRSASVPAEQKRAARQRAYRLRRRQGIAAFRVLADEHRLISAMQAAGRLSEADGLSRQRVEQELSRLAADFIARWRYA